MLQLFSVLAVKIFDYFKVFGLSVVTLALLSLGSEILSNVTKGFAMLPWHMYLSIAFGIFRSIGGPMCRTIVSNIVPASDLGKSLSHYACSLLNYFIAGKIFSIKNVFQSFAPFGKSCSPANITQILMI